MEVACYILLHVHTFVQIWILHSYIPLKCLWKVLKISRFVLVDLRKSQKTGNCPIFAGPAEAYLRGTGDRRATSARVVVPWYLVYSLGCFLSLHLHRFESGSNFHFWKRILREVDQLSCELLTKSYQHNENQKLKKNMWWFDASHLHLEAQIGSIHGWSRSKECPTTLSVPAWAPAIATFDRYVEMP